MRRIGNVLRLAALGLVFSGLLSYVIFIILGLFDSSNRPDEVFAFGILFAAPVALMGMLVGACTALVRSSVWGGTAIGLAATALLILAWSLLNAGNRGLLWALSESTRFLGVLAAAPLVLTGMATARLQQRRAL